MQRILFAAAVLILAASAGAFAQGGKVTGTVTFGQDNAVVHQVTVRIVELKRTAQTDDYGVYSFDNVPAGTYQVTTHLEGFTDNSAKVVVTEGATATSDFQLKIAGITENVTVTAGGGDQLPVDSLAAVSTLDSTEITSRAAVGLGDVLEDQPGVAKRSGGSAASRPVIRGFDGDRVKVTSDGISVGSLASQSGDHAEPVDALAVERIEVIKGPATLLYGSGAIGGVVNAISGHDEAMHPGLRGYFSTIGGINSAQASVAGGVEYGYKNWMVWGNLSGQRSSDYKAGGDFGRVQNTFTRDATGSAGFGYYGKRAFANATYSYYQNRYGIPLDIYSPDPEERSLRMHRGDLKLNFGYNDPSWAISGIKLTVDLSRYRHQELGGVTVGTTFRNDVNSVRGLFEQKTFGKWSGRFGFDTFGRDYSTIGDEILVDGPVKQNNFAVFALEELKFDRVTFQAGARVEHNSYNPLNPALIDRSFTGFSGAAGAKVNVWKGGVLVANFTHSFRSPALDELYNHGPHDGSLSYEIGDPNLRPETSDGIDLSLRQESGRFRGEANFYYYAMKNYVFLAPTGVIDAGSGLPEARYLQADSRFAGTELSLTTKIDRYFSVVTALDYVNAELKDGTPLPRIAPLRARAALDFRYKDLEVRPEFVAVARQDRVFLNETGTAGYGLVNLTANYVVSQKHFAHIFSVNAFNLTNKLYFNHISFIKDISPEMGRGVKLSYTVRYF